MATNPRFPYSFRILRAAVENGSPVVDNNGEPFYSVVPVEIAISIDGVPMRDVHGKFVTETVEEVPFGYRTQTRNLSEAGAVVNKTITLHCPVFLGEILFGDVLELTDYEGVHRVRAAKKQTFNFGTNVFIDELGN